MCESSDANVGFPVKLVSPRITLLAIAIAVFCFASSGFSQDDQNHLFEHAVQAYNNNDFTEAQRSFEAVKGPHTEEAEQYVSKIKAYREAMTLGESVLNRSADELDVRSLDYAIKKFEEALSIKSDGPRDPKGKLRRAQTLKAPLEEQVRSTSEAWEKEFCQKALEAARTHHYKEAVLYSCPLANDSPGYSCGGDEALHLCQQMRELVQLNPDSTLPSPLKKSSPAESPGAADARSAFQAATAAYESNDFDRATTLLQVVKGSEQSEARQYLKRIESYNFFMKQAEQSLGGLHYDQARANYQEAARIKADGPGEPKAQAILMDLEQGISEFYSGNYDEADLYLAAYAEESTQRQDLAHFYLGASKISRFLLGGGQDRSLRDEALSEFRIAKQQGFQATNQDVSPKILKAYEQVSF